jgi:hypothetical protein
MVKGENSFGIYFIAEETLHFICKQGLNLDKDSAIEIAKDLLALQQGKTLLPLCVDITGLSAANKPARDFMAIESARFCSRLAFIANSPRSATIGNFFLLVSKPLVPTKLFTDKKKAMEYLHRKRL